MYIINNNNKDNISKNTSKFKIIFQAEQESRAIASELDLLIRDDWKSVWQVFQGADARQLLNSAIDGLIVFLSCQRSENIIIGEYFSLDCIADGQLLADYVHEGQNDAQIDIEAHAVAA